MVKKLLTVIMCMVVVLLVACSNDDMHRNNTSKEETKAVFKTENIVRITFYAYHGGGKGSDVSAENLEEMISWLGSFVVDTDREFPNLTPPGTNTIQVEIEYSDGSIIKQGMDTIVISGITYYISGDAAPECYDEILEKINLE